MDGNLTQFPVERMEKGLDGSFPAVGERKLQRFRIGMDRADCIGHNPGGAGGGQRSFELVRRKQDLHAFQTGSSTS